MIEAFLRRAILGAALAVAAAPAAQAHAFLDRSEPKVGGTLSAAPTEVRIWFTEALEPAFSSITVANAAGAAVTAGKTSVDPKDPKLLEVGLKPLPAGTYHVRWRVISVDSHPTQGDFTFSVAP
jgi:copper resistance protein C